MKKLTLVIALLYAGVCLGQAQTTVKIDQYIQGLMQKQGIPGVSLAVIKDNKVLHKKNYGYANLEHQVPVTAQSIYRVYSLTKLIVSVGIFQLIEKRKLSLEDKVSQYVSHLPKEWQSIQIKHLLSHSSGIPDMAPIPSFKDLTEQQAKEKVFAQECKFTPGERYDYNQTGFWLLKQVIEKITNDRLSSWIMKHQFGSTSDTAFFSSDSRDIVRHRVTPYFPFTKRTLTIDHSYLQGDYAHAQNGLNISLAEFIRWDHLLRNNKLLKKKSRNLMWQNYPYSQSSKVFTYGWDKHFVDGRTSYGFSGSLVTAYRIFPTKNVSIILLSNGLTKFYNIEQAMNAIATLVMLD
ncbi:hypothetical protein BKI52_44735 [marine bacterium AO1-C]|nr:hypothetical protein BKI52_44735 [marine bacterium AO1-C]